MLSTLNWCRKRLMQPQDSINFIVLYMMYTDTTMRGEYNDAYLPPKAVNVHTSLGAPIVSQIFSAGNTGTYQNRYATGEP